MMWIAGLLDALDLEILEHVSDADFQSWDAAMYKPHLVNIPYVPISASEIYLAAHYLPLFIIEEEGVSRLVADLHYPDMRRPVFSPTGEWTAGYVPLALRSLPYLFDANIQLVKIKPHDHSDNTTIERTSKEITGLKQSLKVYSSGIWTMHKIVKDIIDSGWIEPRTQGQSNNQLVVDMDAWASTAPVMKEANELFIAIAFSHKCTISSTSIRNGILDIVEPNHKIFGRRSEASMSDFLSVGVGLNFQEFD